LLGSSFGLDFIPNQGEKDEPEPRDQGGQEVAQATQRHRANIRPHENQQAHQQMPAQGGGWRCYLRRTVRARPEHPYDPDLSQVLIVSLSLLAFAHIFAPAGMASNFTPSN